MSARARVLVQHPGRLLLVPFQQVAVALHVPESALLRVEVSYRRATTQPIGFVYNYDPDEPEEPLIAVA